MAARRQGEPAARGPIFLWESELLHRRKEPGSADGARAGPTLGTHRSERGVARRSSASTAFEHPTVGAWRCASIPR